MEGISTRAQQMVRRRPPREYKGSDRRIRIEAKEVNRAAPTTYQLEGGFKFSISLGLHHSFASTYLAYYNLNRIF